MIQRRCPRLLGGILAAAVLGAAQPARAQGTIGDVLTFLLTNRSVQTDDFNRDAAAAAATAQTLSRALLADMTTLPVSSAQGGFVYRMNPTLGTIDRASDTFGPVFTERALTSGRHQFSFGATYQSLHFDGINGRSLTSGTLVTTANQFVDEAAPFDVETLTLNIRTKTMTLFGTVGVTDRLDIGAAVPFVSVTLDGERYDTYRAARFLQARGSASASGVADIAVRAKYRLIGSSGTGFAAGTEVRLPTGSEENLLGSGAAAVKIVAIGSFEEGRFAGHVNGGVVRGGVSGEVDYSGAGAYAITDRVTAVGEIVGRRIDALATITDVALPHPTIPDVETLRLVAGTNGTWTTSAVAGVKLNLVSNWLLSVHTLWSPTDSGLHARPTALAALEYSVAR